MLLLSYAVKNMQYKFSFIIPIYKAEKYLEDAIESIINQTIGFEDNIQLILVNDGSPDNSKEICKKYQEQYINNIIYLEQVNSGVSEARNNGFKYAEGEIINFLDADDKWQLNACEKVENFLEKHKEIDVVACELEYFEAKSGIGHPLNFKFTNDKIINIFKNPNEIIMHMASCFLRRQALEGLKFNKALKYGEDSLLINTIILDKKQYGVLKSVHYMYRKREDETSAIDGCRFDKRFYIETLHLFHNKIIDKSIEKTDIVCPYIQYVLMYDLQWRIKRETPEGILNKTEQLVYKNMIRNILYHIEDNVILSQRNIWKEHKIYALSLKYNENITNNLEQVGCELFYKSKRITSLFDSSILKIGYITILDKKVKIEGLINTPINKNNYKIYVTNQYGKAYELEKCIDYKKREKKCLDGHYYYDKYFTITIPLIENDILKLNFLFSYKKQEAKEINIGFLDICKLNPRGYLKTKTNLIERKGNKLIIRNMSKRTHIRMEKEYDRKLLKDGVWKLIIYRILSIILNYLQKNEIWIISDRPSIAGDNGEAFFKYLNKKIKLDKKIKPYFAISKTSPDYKRMKDIGKVIDYNSIKYKILFLLSSKVISSQASDYVINPFGKAKKYMKDLYKFDFVFLQHGITKDDLSSWLNKMDKNINIFITASKKEYDSIINGNYYYDSSIVKLTGFARYDYLKNNKTSKKIAIIPTWRHGINGCLDNKENPIYNKNFKKTTFFKFYNELINNDILLEKMKEKGYEGTFFLHPLFEAQASHFTENGVIKVNKEKINYNKIFEEYSLMITDYSSVFFDFAYLNKPVIYTQFDEKEFFESHSYDKGYFNYKKDGFGPVVETIEDAVLQITKSLEKDCKLNDFYEKRISDFFPEERTNNCKRIYEELIKTA